MGLGGEDGQLAVYVKDQTSDEYAEVWVTFTQVQVHQAGNDTANDTAPQGPAVPGNETGNESAPQGGGAPTYRGFQHETAGPQGSEGGWITVVDEPDGVSVNLKNFTGDSRAFLGSDDLEAGTYTQIRITVTEAWGVQNATTGADEPTGNESEGNETSGGERVDFTVPSGELKIVRSFEVTANQTTAVTLDFDLDRSIQPAGQSGQVVFKPVLGQIVIEEDAEEPSMMMQPGDEGPPMGEAEARA